MLREEIGRQGLRTSQGRTRDVRSRKPRVEGTFIEDLDTIGRAPVKAGAAVSDETDRYGAHRERAAP
jgi:hypothetical protein